MSQDRESTCSTIPRRRPAKKYAILGGFIFTAGVLSSLTTWALFREVWISCGVVTLIGAFLLLFSLIVRSTRMGEA